MATAERIVARSRSTYVCNATAKTSVGTQLPDICIVSTEVPVTVSFSEGEPVGTTYRQLIVSARIDQELTGKPAAAFRAQWEYWNGAQNRADNSEKLAPPSVTPALGDVLKRLSGAKNEAAHNMAGLLRWRWGLGLPAQPLRYLRGEIAYDATAWATLGAASIKLRVGPASPTAVGPGHVTELVALVDAGIAEPLAHELLTEAGDLRKTAPRSALLLSCTALEVGTKRFIAFLAPQTAWLITELPSPPVERLLREYVPTLPRRAYMRAESERFSHGFLNEVKKAVAIRNRIAHQGSGTIDADWLEDWLSLCRDLLHLLDVYSGHVWAAGLIRNLDQMVDP